MSDIWNDYEQIAIKQGLISVSAEDRKETKTKRYDSTSDDALRFLYNVEPESIYKSLNMIENAHPETCVIAPAYDAMNGVIENVQQCQNIMSYIALKTPDGKLINRRYVKAKSDLIHSLVRAGFTMDNRDETDLMVLADSCSHRLADEKPIVKEAWIVPAIWAASIIIPSAIGYFGYAQTSVVNLLTNCSKVKDALGPLMDKPYVEDITQAIELLQSLAEKSKNNIDIVTQIKHETTKSIPDLEKNLTAIDSSLKSVDDYQKQTMDIARKIPEWIKDIEITAQNDLGVESEWYTKMKNLFGRLTWSPSEILIDHLRALQQVIMEDAKTVTPAKKRIEEVRKQIEAKITEAKNTTQTTTPSTPANPTQPKEDIANKPYESTISYRPRPSTL